VATRFYSRATDLPPVTSVAYQAWADTTQGVRRNLDLAKAAATETRSGTLSGATGNRAVAVQAISPPLQGDQTISGTFTLIVRARELAATDNINQRNYYLAVISNDGSTVRGALKTLSAAGVTTEYGTTLSGIQFTLNNTITSVNALDGDRIILEYGPGETSTGTTPQWEIILGGDGTDHTTTNGDTTGTVGWFELSTTLTFQSAAAIPAARSRTLAAFRSSYW
jgi:hypothetical protein